MKPAHLFEQRVGGSAVHRLCRIDEARRGRHAGGCRREDSHPGSLEASDRAMPVFGTLDSRANVAFRNRRPAAARSAAGRSPPPPSARCTRKPASWSAPRRPAPRKARRRAAGRLPRARRVPQSRIADLRAARHHPAAPPQALRHALFAADVSAIAKKVEGMVGPDSELIETRWLTFKETEKAELPAITRVILEEVQARLDAGFRREIGAVLQRALRQVRAHPARLSRRRRTSWNVSGILMHAPQQSGAPMSRTASILQQSPPYRWSASVSACRFRSWRWNWSRAASRTPGSASTRRLPGWRRSPPRRLCR